MRRISYYLSFSKLVLLASFLGALTILPQSALAANFAGVKVNVETHSGTVLNGVAVDLRSDDTGSYTGGGSTRYCDTDHSGAGAFVYLKTSPDTYMSKIYGKVTGGTYNSYNNPDGQIYFGNGAGGGMGYGFGCSCKPLKILLYVKSGYYFDRNNDGNRDSGEEVGPTTVTLSYGGADDFNNDSTTTKTFYENLIPNYTLSVAVKTENTPGVGTGLDNNFDEGTVGGTISGNGLACGTGTGGGSTCSISIAGNKTFAFKVTANNGTNYYYAVDHWDGVAGTSLSVSGNMSFSNKAFTVYLKRVNTTPPAQPLFTCTVSPDVGLAPLVAKVTSTITQGNLDLNSFNYTMGDTNDDGTPTDMITNRGTDFIYTYSKPGTYTVTATNGTASATCTAAPDGGTTITVNDNTSGTGREVSP